MPAGLRQVVVDVAALLALDPAEQLGEHLVVGERREPGVPRLCRPLVDDSEGHVDGQEVLRRRRDPAPEQRAVADAVPQPVPHRRDARRPARFPMGPQHIGQRLPVPVLLEVPQREELADLRVVVRLGVEQVPHVARRVLLDVMHVPHDPQQLRPQRSPPERLAEIQVGIVEPPADLLVPVEVERHARSTALRSIADDLQGAER
jgi:hypothetical protein